MILLKVRVGALQGLTPAMFEFISCRVPLQLAAHPHLWPHSL